MSTTNRKPGRSKRASSSGEKTSSKKKKATSPSEEYWTANIQPRLHDASKEQIGALAKELFEGAWAAGGKKAATKIAAPFAKKLARDAKTNMNVAGSWEFIGKTGELTIGDDIRTARYFYDGSQGDELDLTSLKTADTLVYEGRLDEWGCCRDAFDVEMTLEYDPDTDTIEGAVCAEPCGDVEYGPDDAFGGSFTFTASRK